MENICGIVKQRAATPFFHKSWIRRLCKTWHEHVNMKFLPCSRNIACKQILSCLTETTLYHALKEITSSFIIKIEHTHVDDKNAFDLILKIKHSPLSRQKSLIDWLIDIYFCLQWMYRDCSAYVLNLDIHLTFSRGNNILILWRWDSPWGLRFLSTVVVGLTLL